MNLKSYNMHLKTLNMILKTLVKKSLTGSKSFETWVCVYLVLGSSYQFSRENLFSLASLLFRLSA